MLIFVAVGGVAGVAGGGVFVLGAAGVDGGGFVGVRVANGTACNLFEDTSSTVAVTNFDLGSGARNAVRSRVVRALSGSDFYRSWTWYWKAEGYPYTVGDDPIYVLLIPWIGLREHCAEASLYVGFFGPSVWRPVSKYSIC